MALGAALVAVATWRLTRWAGRRRLRLEVLDRPANAVASSTDIRTAAPCAGPAAG